MLPKVLRNITHLFDIAVFFVFLHSYLQTFLNCKLFLKHYHSNAVATNPAQCDLHSVGEMAETKRRVVPAIDKARSLCNYFVILYGRDISKFDNDVSQRIRSYHFC